MYHCAIQLLDMSGNGGTTDTQHLRIFIVGVFRMFFYGGDKS